MEVSHFIKQLNITSFSMASYITKRFINYWSNVHTQILNYTSPALIHIAKFQPTSRKWLNLWCTGIVVYLWNTGNAVQLNRYTWETVMIVIDVRFPWLRPLIMGILLLLYTVNGDEQFIGGHSLHALVIWHSKCACQEQHRAADYKAIDRRQPMARQNPLQNRI